MSVLSKVLAQIGLVERRKDGRVPVHGLEVVYWAGAEQKKCAVRDISPTGIFLLTQEGLQPGTDSVLTVVPKRVSRNCGPAVNLRARAVRRDGVGTGLTFVRNEAEARQWLEMVSRAADLTAPDDALGRLRVAKALYFLNQISASAAEEICQLMSTALNRERWERLIALVLEVEERLAVFEHVPRIDVSSQVIREILKEGSKVEDEATQALWLNLLTSSCVAGADDEESLHISDVLSKMIAMDHAIFSAACERMRAGLRSAPGDIYFSAEEMRHVAHTPNLVAIEQHLHHLHDLGLLGKTVKPLKGEQIDRANMTLSPFGFRLYSRCCEPERLSMAACG